MMRPTAGSLDWKYAAVMGAVVLGVISVLRAGKQEVQVCREILGGLAAGKASVERRIDWTNLQAVDVNVGQTYTGLKDDQDRARYRRLFIENFASGFSRSGTDVRAFRNWRVHERGQGQVVVAVEHPTTGKTLLLTLSRKKLQGIQWQ